MTGLQLTSYRMTGFYSLEKNTLEIYLVYFYVPLPKTATLTGNYFLTTSQFNLRKSRISTPCGTPSINFHKSA